jgi:putative acetyltransferase
MRQHSVIHTPKLGDYGDPGLGDRYAPDFLRFLRTAEKPGYPLCHLAMMLICRDSDQRITGFAGVAPARSKCFIDPDHRGRSGREIVALCPEHLNADELDVSRQNH